MLKMIKYKNDKNDKRSKFGAYRRLMYLVQVDTSPQS